MSCIDGYVIPVPAAKKEAYREMAVKVRKDPRMQPDGGMPFEGKRMSFGGFEWMLDSE